MNAAPTPVPLETLLTHRAWVRRLARSLVIDDPTADDVEQQTWLAALRHPPRHHATARAWLGRVVRNFAMDSGRARRRRDAHELSAARPEAVRSTRDVVADAEAHTQVVTAVHSLAEPYRTTVLLRWFEDLAPATVADRMGVPLETVRTRLRRAHATLRDDLESRADHETDWVAALVPLTGIRPDVAAAAQAAALGGAVMGTKTSIAAGLGVALAGVVAGSVLVGAAERPDTAEEIAALRARVAALESNASAAAARRDATGGGRRDAGIGDRVSAHDDRIAGVEAALDAVRADVKRIGTVETGTRAADRAAAPEVDADAELARLRALSSDELLTEIRTLNQAGAGGAGSAAQKKFGQSLVRACDVLLGRDTKGATRYQVLFIKGFGHRAQITANEQEHRAYAEAAFRDAMLLAGAGTDEAREAEKQIAWTAQRAGDPRAAAEIFVRLADDTRDTAASRAANRLSAAGAFDVAKDTARAAVELQSLIDEFAGAASAQASVELARTKLDELSRRARQR